MDPGFDSSTSRRREAAGEVTRYRGVHSVSRFATPDGVTPRAQFVTAPVSPL